MRSSTLQSRLIPVLFVVLLAGSGCTQLKRWAYASGDRDEWQQVDRVIETLAIPQGARVADLGSGGGYFTFHLADAVGPRGSVYAVDVDAAMNEALAADAEERGYENVQTVLAGVEETGLDAASVDLIFSSNTYHHLEDRVAYFRRAASALAPGGRIAIIDFKPEGWFQKRHATEADKIHSEMAAAGYRLLAEHDFLERQYFLVFAVPES